MSNTITTTKKELVQVACVAALWGGVVMFGAMNWFATWDHNRTAVAFQAKLDAVELENIMLREQKGVDLLPPPVLAGL